jgi:hyperosmotically inducible periplasmic protein
MKSRIAAFMAVVVFSMPVSVPAADTGTVKDNVKQGANEVKEAVKDGYRATREGVKDGVQSVKEGASNIAISTKVIAAFAKDKDVSALNIKVDTDYKGAVTLSGIAKSNMEADKAVTVARTVSGVTSVTNNLQIQPK